MRFHFCRWEWDGRLVGNEVMCGVDFSRGLLSHLSWGSTSTSRNDTESQGFLRLSGRVMVLLFIGSLHLFMLAVLEFTKDAEK